MTGAGTWAIVPVKQLTDAKRRLAAVLAPEQRKRLVLLMLEDVLAALAASLPTQQILIVTPDEEIEALAIRCGACVLREAAPPLPESSGVRCGDTSLNAAVTAGVRHVLAGGAKRALVVPADVPLASPAEFATLTARGSEGRPRIVLVPSAGGDGTNAMMLTPPDILAPSFGSDSFVSHLASAAARRIDTEVLHLAGLAADIDTPTDLACLLGNASVASRYGFLRSAPGTMRSPGFGRGADG